MSNYLASNGMLPAVQDDLSGDASLQMSRRSLLAGSAGLAAAAIGMAAQPAAAQSHTMDMTAAVAPSGSSRLYDVNEFNGVTDIAHDPSDLPPPIKRTGAEKVRVDLETVELEARLDQRFHLQFLDFQRPGPRSVCSRSRRRPRRSASQEQRKQHDDAQCRLPCRDRPRRRRRSDERGPGGGEDRHLQGAQPRPLRLPLRSPSGRPAYLERHVRAHPRGARRRARPGGSRVLRDAGRDLHRGAVRN